MTRTEKKTNTGIELLRGFSALTIILFHIIDHHGILDSDYFPTFLKQIKPSGQLAVLLFFILSGYVIGVTHQEKLGGRSLWIYLQKRFIRIYPIYCLAILLSIFVAPFRYPIKDIIGNLTLTQNIISRVIITNGPAWSLNYEIIFYLLFIPVSFFNIKTPIVIAISLAIGTMNTYLPFNPLITAYAYGFCFWLAGLFIARNFREGGAQLNLPALLIYTLGIGILLCENPSLKISSLLWTPSLIKAGWWSQKMISIDDLVVLPYCFMIVTLFADKSFKYKAIIFTLLQILPLIICYHLLVQRPDASPQLMMGAAYLVISLVLYFIRVPDLYLRLLGWQVAGISYGLYIIHYPLLFLVDRLPIAGDSLWLYMVRIFMYLSCTILIAWLLEKKLQPKIRCWLMPTPPLPQT